MSATINDVARVAGVSPSTVSRALSGGPVNAATRDLVRRTAETLGYQPNRAARELITGRTGALGLLVPDLGNPYFTEVIKGASSRSRTSSYPIFVSDTDEHVAREHETIASLRHNTDGLILCSPRGTDEELLALAQTGPTVMVSRHVPGVPSVMGDAAAGIEQALQHLGALGHRKVAYINGPAGSYSEGRRSAGLAAAQALGIEVVEVPAAAPTFDAGVLAADLVLTTGATAIIAFNDLIAIGVLNRLTSRGIRVPEDMSLVGHDDIPMASMCTPNLTTIAVQKERLGFTATDLLLRLLDQRAARSSATEPDDTCLQLPSMLVVRGSTGVAPSTPPRS
ncbi:LacI family DNA-binding transcriptional regulator [Demequina lignilytica]|uniref:LacI family DNA-binding transcriptional regulator n=1 Tax=Demequina lignilytica TaxID=3051663 RepID=A0AAW7LZT1_9MICO|nr:MULTISPECIES: LacI family DNA-binding transcriptional regulator [unclassified Demequina]MDN4478565.1 LacI family DNA-binding transcriptional regulator [Demequina sp. SYSU T00039-1]MDN4482277.1 LacI family DNA-binding transcriptional regulator [Demequina sp. SYSU T0a273]MDN4486928.1 LacI family DNA-binding transcriptional regulator [Demequina sp. SYSU T00039]MDN4489612.1 LacI family DNA-binding transcriptional regulator [Demequina sp. SYSU T00068]